jgi:hypothetical protein
MAKVNIEEDQISLDTPLDDSVVTEVETTPEEEAIAAGIPTAETDINTGQTDFISEIKNKIETYEAQLENASFDEKVAIENELAGLKKLI